MVYVCVYFLNTRTHAHIFFVSDVPKFTPKPCPFIFYIKQTLKLLSSQLFDWWLALLVGLVACEQSSIDRLHTRWTSEAPHEPIVDTFDVVSMHARQIAHRISNQKLDHANNASIKTAINIINQHKNNNWLSKIH